MFESSELFVFHPVVEVPKFEVEAHMQVTWAKFGSALLRIKGLLISSQWMELSYDAQPSRDIKAGKIRLPERGNGKKITCEVFDLEEGCIVVISDVVKCQQLYDELKLQPDIFGSNSPNTKFIRLKVKAKFKDFPTSEAINIRPMLKSNFEIHQKMFSLKTPAMEVEDIKQNLSPAKFYDTRSRRSDSEYFQKNKEYSKREIYADYTKNKTFDSNLEFSYSTRSKKVEPILEDPIVALLDSYIESNKIIQQKEMFIYPFSGENAVTMNISDARRLQQGVFLNDIIIFFYLKYLEASLTPERRDQIHMFNTFFYSILSTKQDNTEMKVKDIYPRVKTWTKKVNLFQKTTIFVPINENAHWYLVIVQNPKNMIRAKVQEILSSDEDEEQETVIAVLDSLGSSRPKAQNRILEYLKCEIMDKLPEYELNPDAKIRKLRAKVPIQPNYCDCGVYMLHYIERMLQYPDMISEAMQGGKDRIWIEDEIPKKRLNLMELVIAKSKEYWNKL